MDRVEILKTYKIYIGGAFPRTESGRYYTPVNGTKQLGNICLSSRKDFKNSVVAARKACGKWAGKSAANRSQIMYRIAEILEGRKTQFIAELELQGNSKAKAEKEVLASIDRFIYYAGWCDKFSQVFSSVNPVASSHFNFTSPEPMGVISVCAPEGSGLLGLVNAIAPVLAGGNTCVVLASESMPLCAITFAEVLNSSDVPGGTVNILTGKRSELLEHMASHMDVNGFSYSGTDKAEIKKVKECAVENLKRVSVFDGNNLLSADNQSPYFIDEFVEMKTTWHPIEMIAGAGSGY
jgi:acyl-CoA reductase-like NAD-dependent aldehyde dehydrogenase